jgi:hypothetical protein
LANVYSVGDVCIAIGVAMAIHSLAGSRLVPRRSRASAEGSTPGYARDDSALPVAS